MSDSNELKIKISTTTDNTGAISAANALGGIKEKADGVTSATKALGDKSKRAVEGLNRSFEGLNQALTGGVGLARGLGTAFGGIFQALGKFTWVGLLINAIGLVISNLERLKEVFSGTAKQAAEQSNKTADAWVDALKRASEARNDALKVYFEEIAASAARARSEIDATTTAVIAQTDAAEAVAIAEVDADESLPNSEKLKKKAGLRQSYREARNKTQLNAMDAAEAGQKQELAATQAGVGEADAGLDTARKIQANAVGDPVKIKAELDQLKQRGMAISYATAQARSNIKIGAKDSGAGKVTQLLADSAQNDQRIADKKRELADADPELETNQKKAAAAKDAVTKAQEVKAAAEKKAAEAALKLADLQRDNERKRLVLEATSSSQNRVDELQTGTQVKDSLKQEKAAADTQSADAATLFNVRAGAGTFREGAQQIGKAAGSKNPEMFTAAKNLNDAAKAAEEGGTTPEEAKALVEAAAAFAAVMQAQKVESALFKTALKTLADQVATLRTR